MPTFPLLALRSTLGNILDATVFLFYFFKNRVFPYKTPASILPTDDLVLISKHSMAPSSPPQATNPRRLLG